MRCLLTGTGGQLATELMRRVPQHIDVHAMSIDSLDITSPDGISSAMESVRPELVINAAAWTDVDGAEDNEPEAAAINSDGVRFLAESCDVHSARLVHVSTDFVFDGRSDAPYLPTDETSPLSAYGRTKRAGEQAVLDTLPETGTIVRTAWLYSSHGHNFLLTMLKLMGERDRIQVVSDQHGTPTSAASLATTIWDLAGASTSGVYHWTDGGRTSWHGFARGIHELARTRGILDHDVVIEPIPTEQWPTPARRPASSVLDISSTEAVINRTASPWEEELASILDDILVMNGNTDE